jgi:hypothetical protein
MNSTPYEQTPLATPLAGLERALADEFVRERGYDPAALEALAEPERHALLSAASTHAALKLAEIESRSRFVHDMHGDGAGRV